MLLKTDWRESGAAGDGAIESTAQSYRELRDDSGALVEYIGTIMDMTDRKRAEDERERLMTREQAAHAEAAAAQHRFGELVNSIEGDQATRLRGVMFDITCRKRAEAQ